jgi:hypothetical protein
MCESGRANCAARDKVFLFAVICFLFSVFCFLLCFQCTGFEACIDALAVVRAAMVLGIRPMLCNKLMLA